MARATGEKEKSLQMERIYVAVRSRPLSPDESRSSPWQINANSVSLANQSHKFEFDTIFGENCKTKEVYEARTKDIVASAVSGFNGTVFAYGQTSSGKTHTMKGSDAEPGIIPLAIQDLFHAIQETGDREFLLRMSYMEIYNEEINDLLAPEHRKLQIHENTERGIYVAGLKEEIVNCPEQVLDLMKFGESHRHIGETNMNLYSSRSHTIFRMIIESREKVEDNELNDSCDAVRVSVLNLVDLAGSERVAKTGAEGKRLKEGSHINKSLLTLGSVIQKLSEGAQSQGGHVPYRDSKLTRILQPALGGNANTAIICNITLAQIHADETKSSLQFASRAKRVTNCVRVNEILTDAALLKRQKKEIEELRAKLMVSHNEQWEEQILTLRNTLLQSELEKERISLELEEEKKAKAQREERLLEQARKIENLSSLVLLSDRDEKSVLSSKSQKKRRETWCPAHSVPQVVTEDISRLHRASSGTTLLPFETLIEEDESCLDELENRNTYEIPFPEALSLLNVTSRRKISSKENNEATEYRSSAEKLNEQTGTPGRNTIKSLTLRESEAILVIKQLEDQIKMLELEKASTQNYLDDVLKLATQQNNSFTKKYEEMQQEVFKAREESRIAQEKLPLVKLFEETLLENVPPTHTEVLKVVEGLSLGWDQSKNSTDGLICFVEDLLQNFSILSKMLQNIKLSADGEISEFKSVFSEFEMLTIQLSGKAKDLSLEKSLLEGQLIDCQREIAKLKSDMNSCDNSIAEYVAATHTEVLEEIEGLSLLWDQSKNSTDGLICFVEDLFHNFSILSKMLQNVKLSVDGEISEFKSVFSEFEILTIQLSGKAKDLNLEKSLLEGQLIDCQREIAELKCVMDSREKTLAEMKEQHEFEKEELCTQLVMMQNEIAVLSSSSLMCEIESLRKELDRAKTKLKDTESKLKTAIHEKIKLEGEKAQAGREIKELKGQMALLERDIRKNKSKLTDLAKKKESTGEINHNLMREYQNLEMNAVEMKSEIASLEGILINTIAEKEEALTRLEVVTSELEELSKMMSSAKSEIESMKEEVENKTHKLKEAELLVKSSKSCCELLQKEKEEMEMQLTNALLEAEAQKSMWLSQERMFIEVTEQKETSDCEIQRLASDLSEAKLELEACREEYKLLKKSSDDMILQLNMEKDRQMANISNLEAKIQDREYQNLELNAVEMKSEIASLEGILINTIAEKEEALTRLEVVTSELEELSKMMNSAESEIESMKEEVENKTHKLKEAELLVKSSKSCCELLQKEKEEMEMQLTNALLEAEAQKSMWLSKERTFIELTEQKETSDCEIQRLARDLSEAKLELEACREEYKLLKKSSDDMILQLNMEKDRLMANINNLEAKIHNREYQNLEMNAVEMKSEIASLEGILINTIAEKEEALTRLEVVTSELEELSKMMNSAESKIESMKEEVENKTHKLKEAELLVKSSKSCCELLQKEKEEMEMQLTNALLEAEAQKSMWLSKERTFIELTEQKETSDCEIQRLASNLSEAKLELEACREEYKLLKKSSDDMILQLNMEKDRLMANINNLEVKIHDDLEQQLVTVTKERESLMCTNEKLCFKINETENLRKNYDHTISRLKTEKDKLMANITTLETKIHDDLECQLVAITKERDALMCTNEKMFLEMNEAEVLRQNSDHMVLNAKMERDELAARISEMEAKMHEEKLRYETEITMCQCRCRSMQEKVVGHKGKYAELLKEHKRMNEKFKEASDTLKEKLREYGLEILRLKKELASNKGGSACASTSAQ